MSPLPFIKPNAVKIKVSFASNCDDVQLTWRTLDSRDKDSPVEGCLGFMIERERKAQADADWEPGVILRNRVGFDATGVDPKKPETLSQPSNIWPFQRYDWTEHGANSNESVRYRISCVGSKADTIIGKTELVVLARSEWTDEIKVSAKAGDETEVYFNRGAVMSQYVARMAREKNWTAADIKKNVKSLKEPLRIFLSGELRLALLRQLDAALQNPFLDLYASLFELDDDELIGKLKQLGPRAHIVLTDGSNSKKLTGQPVQYIDENKDVRQDLKDAGVKVSDRILAQQGLGHNKLLVTVDNRSGKAVSAWTGSTNWTSTGLCTQLNNGILLKNSDVADLYYQYWKKLSAAGSAFPPALVSFNGDKPKVVANAQVWFTRTKKAAKGTTPVDIKFLQDLVNSAQKSILYVMFQPGGEPLGTIVQQSKKQGMYVRGVVSTVISSNQEKFRLMDEKGEKPYITKMKQPDGIEHDFAWWVTEVTRKIFLNQIGFAITHAKMIVIDAFSDNPIVITGSYNFSISASQDNDENFIVITGNKELARHYAVACLSTFEHYRWRAYTHEKHTAGEEIWSHLKPDPAWQQSYLQNHSLLRQLEEWC